MKSTMHHDPLINLLDEYYEHVKAAYRLSGIDKKAAKKSYVQAGFIALKIQALRFRN